MADLKIDKSRYTVDSLYQWDTNQELKIYGLSMVDPEIHFTNEAMGGSIVVDCTVDESGVISVKIPNSLLQYKYSIVAYIAGFEGDTFKTYHKVTIPVKARKRPGDYTLSLSDNEVYSFKSMSDRITNIEDEIKSEGSILYSYTYDNTNIKLVESGAKKTIGEYIPLVSNSLKAVKGLSDKFKTMIDANTKLGETALSIAKGINSAKVFDTTADMEAWLSDENNKGKCDVGNNLYIVDIDVPDWWIAEVLETPDSETGYYYKIAQLEVQKVDLTDINEDIDTLQSDVETLEDNVGILESDTNSLQEELAIVKDTLGYTVGKNLLKFTANNWSTSGVTFTVNNDKSVTVNGTASTTHNYTINSLFTLPKGDYILSGCPEGGSESSYYLELTKYVSKDRIAIDIGQGATFTIDSEDPMILRVYFSKGTIFENTTFYPMIRKANITDDTYEPYVASDVDTRLNNKADVDVMQWKKMTISGGTEVDLSELNYVELEIYTNVIWGTGSTTVSTKLKKIDLSSTETTKTMTGNMLVNGATYTATITYKISTDIFKITNYKVSASSASLDISDTTTTIYYR